MYAIRLGYTIYYGGIFGVKFLLKAVQPYHQFKSIAWGISSLASQPL
jgi:hypothetical protein